MHLRLSGSRFSILKVAKSCSVWYSKSQIIHKTDNSIETQLHSRSAYTGLKSLSLVPGLCTTETEKIGSEVDNSATWLCISSLDKYLLSYNSLINPLKPDVHHLMSPILSILINFYPDLSTIFLINFPIFRPLEL